MQCKDILVQAGLRIKSTSAITFSAGGNVWINEAARKIGKWVPATIAIANANKWTALSIALDPAGVAVSAPVVGVLEVRNASNEVYVGHEVRDNYIRFPDAGEYEIDLLVLPTDAATDNDEPDVLAAYHDAIHCFVLSRWKGSMNDQNPDQDNLMQEFWAEVTRVRRNLNASGRNSNPGTVPVKRR